MQSFSMAGQGWVQGTMVAGDVTWCLATAGQSTGQKLRAHGWVQQMGVAHNSSCVVGRWAGHMHNFNKTALCPGPRPAGL